eukprot:scaffold77535_cov20-Tisochrysis_lutea.AAC.1
MHAEFLLGCRAHDWLHSSLQFIRCFGPPGRISGLAGPRRCGQTQGFSPAVYSARCALAGGHGATALQQSAGFPGVSPSALERAEACKAYASALVRVEVLQAGARGVLAECDYRPNVVMMSGGEGTYTGGATGCSHCLPAVLYSQDTEKDKDTLILMPAGFPASKQPFLSSFFTLGTLILMPAGSPAPKQPVLSSFFTPAGGSRQLQWHKARKKRKKNDIGSENTPHIN